MFQSRYYTLALYRETSLRFAGGTILLVSGVLSATGIWSVIFEDPIVPEVDVALLGLAVTGSVLLHAVEAIQKMELIVKTSKGFFITIV